MLELGDAKLQLVQIVAGDEVQLLDEGAQKRHRLLARVRGSRTRAGEQTMSLLRTLVEELNLVTRDDLDELELRVAQLEHRLTLLEAPHDVPPA